MHAGAQSDSEVAETSAAADGCSDRGYTSDSELYDTPKRDSAFSASDTKLKPSSGSWLMVRSAHHYSHLDFTDICEHFGHNVAARAYSLSCSTS